MILAGSKARRDPDPGLSIGLRFALLVAFAATILVGGCLVRAQEDRVVRCETEFVAVVTPPAGWRDWDLQEGGPDVKLEVSNEAVRLTGNGVCPPEGLWLGPYPGACQWFEPRLHSREGVWVLGKRHTHLTSEDFVEDFVVAFRREPRGGIALDLWSYRPWPKGLVLCLWLLSADLFALCMMIFALSRARRHLRMARDVKSGMGFVEGFRDVDGTLRVPDFPGTVLGNDKTRGGPGPVLLRLGPRTAGGYRTAESVRAENVLDGTPDVAAARSIENARRWVRGALGFLLLMGFGACTATLQVENWARYHWVDERLSRLVSRVHFRLDEILPCSPPRAK